MKILIKLSKEEFEEIVSLKQNRVHRVVDLEINVIDAIDQVLDFPGYDIEVEVV